MKTDFSAGAWQTDALTYAYSQRFELTPVFTQMPDHIASQADEKATYGYENITLLSRQKYTSGTQVTTACAFEGDAAPLIVLAKELQPDARGVLRYGEYLEIVLWKNGVNVWQMWMQDGAVTWRKRLGVEFAVSEGEKHTLSVQVNGETLHITADDRKMSVYIGEMYPSFHAGIDACEGVCRFYSLTVEGEEASAE